MVSLENLPISEVPLKPLADISSFEGVKTLNVFFDGEVVLSRFIEGKSVFFTLEGKDIPLEFPVDTFGFIFDSIQKLNSGKFLAVTRRSINKEPNAFLFDKCGTFIRRFYIGDGIEHVLADPSGGFWVGYFDEGVFNGGEDDLGPEGLVKFNEQGTPIFRYVTDGGHERYIADLYALNIDNEGAVWLCPYTDFYIAKILNERVVFILDSSPVRGAHSLAISAKESILMLSGSYKKPREFSILNIEKDTMRKVHFLDDRGLPIKAEIYFSKSFKDCIYVLWDQKVYVLSLSLALKSIGHWNKENSYSISLATEKIEAAEKASEKIIWVNKGPQDKK